MINTLMRFTALAILLEKLFRRPSRPASGKKLVSLIEQFDFTEEDVADLDRVIADRRQKVRG